jgi:hypothetical protein
VVVVVVGLLDAGAEVVLLPVLPIVFGPEVELLRTVLLEVTLDGRGQADDLLTQTLVLPSQQVLTMQTSSLAHGRPGPQAGNVLHWMLFGRQIEPPALVVKQKQFVLPLQVVKLPQLPPVQTQLQLLGFCVSFGPQVFGQTQAQVVGFWTFGEGQLTESQTQAQVVGSWCFPVGQETVSQTQAQVVGS